VGGERLRSVKKIKMMQERTGVIVIAAGHAIKPQSNLSGRFISILDKMISIDWTTSETIPMTRSRTKRLIPSSFAMYVAVAHGFFCWIISFASAFSRKSLCSSDILHGAECWSVIASASSSMIWIICMLGHGTLTRDIAEKEAESAMERQYEENGLKTAGIPTGSTLSQDFACKNRMKKVLRSLILASKMCVELSICTVVLIAMIGHGMWDDMYVVVASVEGMMILVLCLMWIPAAIIKAVVEDPHKLCCCFRARCCSSPKKIACFAWCTKNDPRTGTSDDEAFVDA
jgi:hypothetical protein